MSKPSPKTVFVTGGSRGIGAGISQCFLEAGYQVAVGYQSHEAGALAICQNYPSQAMAVQVDIGNESSVKQAVQAIKEQFARIDVLVNNAAIGEEKPFLELTDEDWEQTFSVNLLGAVRCIRAALPDMLNNHFGRIINISSVAGQWGGVYRVHYAATKASLINLTQSMAKLYSREGITCNAIAPGLVATDLTFAELDKPESKDKVKNIPVGRLATPEEIGNAALYLASEGAGYITGHTLNINGGMYFG